MNIDKKKAIIKKIMEALSIIVQVKYKHLSI